MKNCRKLWSSFVDLQTRLIRTDGSDDEPLESFGAEEKSGKRGEEIIVDDYPPLPDNLIYSSCARLEDWRDNDNFVYVRTTIYGDMKIIADRLNERLPVVVDFGDMDRYRETAQRMVDFLSGVVYAHKGKSQKNDCMTFTFDTRRREGA